MSEFTLFETRANGKLLLSGEYFVLDGALALAVPVRFGQSLLVRQRPGGTGLLWESRDYDDSIWFSAEYELPYLGVVETSDRSVAEMLASIFRECQRQNPSFLAGVQGLEAVTACDFPRAWGLGTSSTIVAAIARWASVDAYPVLRDTLGGSGYDIACAYAESPLLYRLADRRPEVRYVAFNPSFADQLYFVYLDRKQNSREGIVRYRERSREFAGCIPEVSALTERILNADTIEEFEKHLAEHEQLIGQVIDYAPIQKRLFSDYPGVVKSLGAWGGDFVLATSAGSDEATRRYFTEKGFQTILTWNEMVLPD